MTTTLSPAGAHRPYSRLSISLHWLMLVLLAAVFACIELREYYPRGSAMRDGLKAWHFMLGLSVFLLVWVRLIARWGTSWLPPEPGWTRWPAAAVHLILYAGMIGLPLLGWLVLSADGKPIPFFGLNLPALIAPDPELAERLEDLHKTVGSAGYWLIGLHAAAALFHHFLLRDGTLRRMLPGRR
ncbi:MAG: cytochrome b [Alphaproteobacteria bacterium]|uniref:cytochrome b n=1 Tax=Brevundimonas sp. TaxID=1871086 RepID=UPI0018076202|nr:cytochrome b [Brevundimonas sp.]MBA3048112.1 cytochrome b [Brevundimonas sp.]MBU3969373.1 cytochrome b [Alphaproteobacteria bacterium]MBU3975278.1 cytochrome b [Alphaproteobacteria bacterium]